VKDKSPKGYVPALRFSWLTAIYDPVVRWTTREAVFKPLLVDNAGLLSDMRALDLACGTGTLALLIRKHFSDVDVTGLDGDANILKQAVWKTKKKKKTIQYDCALATQLPYADGSFDRVFSTLFFHHLNDKQKSQAFSEIFRVLKPGGELHVVDWGKPDHSLLRLSFLVVQLLDGFENTKANIEGRLPWFMCEAGLEDVQTAQNINTLLGTLTAYRAVRPLNLTKL